MLNNKIAERIAVALERIATALEFKSSQVLEINRVAKLNPEHIAFAGRVINGESVSKIARECDITVTNARMKILKVFRERNPAKYHELRDLGDYGPTYEPSMRSLISNASHFGF